MRILELGAGVLVGAALGVCLSETLHRIRATSRPAGGKPAEPDSHPSIADAQALVGQALSGAMQAAQLYVGDRLGLYAVIGAEPHGTTTAVRLAGLTGLSQRWLREWLAQQAAMGVLELVEGTEEDDAALFYRLPPAFATVLGDPSSAEYDIGLIQAVPAFMQRAKELPVVFQTSQGLPYNDPDISEAIDRAHAIHTKHCFIPKVLPLVAGGRVIAALESGVRCADLGCGSGCLLLGLAASFPRSTFHGFEISDVALEQASAALAKSGLPNLHFHDSRAQSLDSMGPFPIIFTYDVLHDATRPEELIESVRAALAPGGVWVLGDINCADGVRGNLRGDNKKKSATYFSISMCLCLSSGLSEPGGAGLGTLGFGVSKARQMLGAAGFRHVRVLMEVKSVRWFEVAPASSGLLEEHAAGATALRDFM
jgi:2-polyprenyl-3-methyl-5-hydroxy-6-metoxy-1,4-benzoquinol methylase